MPRRRTHDLTAIYDELAPAVLGYFRSHRVSEPESLTGDVFVAVTDGLSRFDGPPDKLRSWVFSIAHNKRVDQIRRSKLRDEVPADDRVLDELVSTDTPELLDVDLRGALDQLTDDQRDVVILRYVADLSIEAVGELTGRSGGAVKMLQQRALDALAAALERPDEEISDEA